MRRAFFALWLMSAVIGLFLVGQVLHPPVGQLGSPASLLVVAFWLVAVVPLSFGVWFKAQHQREARAVETALTLLKAGDPKAGRQVAEALELALAEEDEAALKKLLDSLGGHVPARLEASLAQLVTAAQVWMKDDGGHASRDEHLAAVREAARPLITQLAQPA